MGPCTSLRQLLKNLCNCTPWEYAVFWKLNHRGCMMLSWEEGHCENSKLLDPVETIRDKLYAHESSTLDLDGCNWDARSPIGLAVSKMSSHLYSSGNGMVGSVAFTGKYKWLSFPKLNSDDLPQEYLDEWQPQLAIGIKTILLVPVGTHGVVQLGSFELVAENEMLVAAIKDLFDTLYGKFGGTTAFTSIGGDLKTFPELHLERSKESMGLNIGQTFGKEQPTIYYDFRLPVISESTFSQTNAQFIYECSLEAAYDFSMVAPTEESPFWDQCFDDPFIVECSSSSLTPEDLFLTLSHCNNDNPTSFSGLSSLLNSYNSEVKHVHYGPCSVADEMDQTCITEVLENTKKEFNGGVSDTFTESLKAGIASEHDCYLLNFNIEEHWLNSPVNANSTIPGFDKTLINEAEVERLVDSLVAELYDTSDEGPLNTKIMDKSFDDSPGNPLKSCLTKRKCENDDVSCVDHNVFSFGNENALMSSPTGSSSSMNGSTLINEEETHQTESGMEKCKSKRLAPAGKKRPKLDDNHKPRPRDRQLIQDRVKELRDLVPNGKKCSIDALLDRTIKHMMFLRSVSSQADKLKKCSRSNSKVLGADHESLEFEDENYGVTWAYEPDSQPEASPLVVKDLDQQGHMLVEMLCTEYGDFLEIAQVMRRLRLTILKGVMESRADKLWAHFIVEASKGFNRMEILWPLMQLLQQNRIPLTSRF